MGVENTHHILQSLEKRCVYKSASRPRHLKKTAALGNIYNDARRSDVDGSAGPVSAFQNQWLDLIINESPVQTPVWDLIYFSPNTMSEQWQYKECKQLRVGAKSVILNPTPCRKTRRIDRSDAAVCLTASSRSCRCVWCPADSLWVEQHVGFISFYQVSSVARVFLLSANTSLLEKELGRL